jgi:hypothetical protein
VPTTVAELFAASGLVHDQTVRWGTRVRLDEPGAYVVARLEDPSAAATACPPEIALHAVRELLDVRPELQLDGRRPTPDALASRLESFWIPDEGVAYIGLAGTSVRSRLGAYYRTPLGARRPHSGGWFLKTLANLGSFYVHVARAIDPTNAEDVMLRRFCSGVSPSTRASLPDPDHPFPFAKLEWPRGTRKRHGITGAREPARP